MNDTERLDFLQALLERSRYTGKCTCRWSTTGRGWRLHETSLGERDPSTHSYASVREAIDKFYELETAITEALGE